MNNSGARISYGKTARMLLLALAGLLAVGVIGSLWMGQRAKGRAVSQATEQAQNLAERSLSLVFRPSDLTAPVDDARAFELSQQVGATVVDPSDFDTVTLFDADGLILYSTEASTIGNELTGERDSIKAAIRGEIQTEDNSGTFSVLLPFHLPSGVGSTVAVQLTRPDGPIASAAGPWRTNALFLFVMLVLLGIAVYGVSRLSQMATAIPTPVPNPDVARQQVQGQAARRIEVPQPGMREEAQARKLAEERARAAEDRLTLLQEQYRKALEELQQFQRSAREPAAGGDPRMEERALRAEGQLVTLQQQLSAIANERSKLAHELDEARAGGSEDKLSRDHEMLLREAERETIGLRAELEGAQTQLSVTRREVEELRNQAGRSAGAQEELTSVHQELQRSLETIKAAQADADRYRRELEELRNEAGRTAGAQEELVTVQQELRRAREALTTSHADADRHRRELEDARMELRALRAEEQRAAILEDELRSTRVELEGGVASHRAELVEREAEFEQKIRTTREEFQRQLADIEETYRGQLGQREADLVARITAAEAQAREAAGKLEAARVDLEEAEREGAQREQRVAEALAEVAARTEEAETLRRETAERTSGQEAASEEAAAALRAVDELREELAQAQAAIEETRAEAVAEHDRSSDASARAEAVERERRSLAERAQKLATQLEDAGAENADLNRKLQELEARRQLEIADDQGRAHIDDLLRVTQDRLAGQTEKLIAAEDRVRELETSLSSASERLDVAEGELRTHQMADALREIRGEHDDAPVDAAASDLDAAPYEDRRASSPFTKELSLDAKKTLSRIMGITQIMKHKKDGKDQAQLIRQLTTYARRLDHTVADLADADRLAHGTVELQVKRTDLEALVQRVVDESGISADHEVVIEAQQVLIAVDPLRTEQVLAGLLRNSGDRTPNGKTIAIRLGPADGGALLSVEDPEPSSDASLSPVVRRFVEVQGGWAKVESRESGGSAFRVFLPDQRSPEEKAAHAELQIVVDTPAEQTWEPDAGRVLSNELRRLAELD